MKKKTLILLGFILLKFILQYLLYNPFYDLQRDEYLHLDQAGHLAWGFQSIPPVTSWIAYVIKLLGNSVFWIRFFPALFGVLTMVIVWKMISELKGNLYALVLGATCVSFSFLLRLNLLFQPNSFDTLFWTLLYFALIKYIHTQKAKWLYIASLVFAIGFLNKYNIIFLVIGIFPAILLSQHRKLLAQKHFYAAAVLGLIVIAPNLLWQYHNNYPVFHHLKELADTQLIYVNRLDFLKEQLFFFIGALPVILASLYALLLYPPFRKYRFFFFSFIFTLFAFVYLKAKGYYAIGLYPVYIAFGSVYLGNLKDFLWKKYVKAVFILLPVLSYILLFNVIFSMKNPAYILEHQSIYKKAGLLHWEDGKDHQLPQDFADMLGWKELAAKVETAYNKLPKTEKTIVLCDNYGQAGAINYYVKNKNIMAVSFNADYINWFDFNKKTINLIRIKDALGSKNELEETAPFFEISSVADSITTPLAREYKTTIFVFRNPKVDIDQRLKAEIH